MWKKVALGVGILILIGLIGLALMAWGLWQNPLAVYEKAGKRALENAGFARGELTTPAGSLVYWSAGSGPPLIFLHGAGDTAAAWSQVAPGFIEGYTVYVADLPGHGDSEPATGPLKLSLIAEGFAALLEYTGGNGKATLVGNSMGGWLALLAAESQPDAIERLFLVNGGGISKDLGDLTMLPTNREEARTLLDALRDPASQPIPDFVLDDIIERSADGPLKRMVDEMADMEANLLDDRLGGIASPTDLIWGASDKLMPISYAEKMAAGLPASRVTRIEACGHIPQNECPAQLAGKLRKLLASAPPAARQVLEEESAAETAAP